MATTQDTEEQTSDETDDLGFAPKLDPKWAMGLPHVLVAALFGLLFLVLNYIPLRATDIWGHVGYGHLILENGTLPTNDPWMPLAEGMLVIDSAWLSQVIFAAADQWIGPQAISHLFALAGLAVFVIWARVFYLQTHRLLLISVGVLMLLLLSWSRMATVRPESLAAVCFALVFFFAIAGKLIPADRDDNSLRSSGAEAPRWWVWLAMPLLFVVWANLHGSFVLGLVVLACFTAGRALDVAWSKRSLIAILQDHRFRQWLLVSELSFAATLINPYGLDLLIYSAKFSSNPNLETVLEWQPLVILSPGGREFALSVALLLVCMRFSRTRIPTAHVLLLAMFAFASVKAIRMIGWYAPVYCFVVMPHLADILGRVFPAREIEPAVRNENGDVIALPPGRSFGFSMVCLLVLWIAFMMSPASRTVMGRSPRSPEKLYMPDTPLALTEYLRENPPQGQVFHPQQWGDWIKRDGPPNLQAFVTTNIHLAPTQVWRDYWRVVGVSAGWERALDRYDTKMVIVDHETQDSLMRALRRSDRWSLAYEDAQAAVFVRNSESPMQRQNEDENSADLAFAKVIP